MKGSRRCAGRQIDPRHDPRIPRCPEAVRSNGDSISLARRAKTTDRTARALEVGRISGRAAPHATDEVRDSRRMQQPLFITSRSPVEGKSVQVPRLENDVCTNFAIIGGEGGGRAVESLAILQSGI